MVLQWFCTDASEFLAARHETCRSTLAFSATLTPFDHFSAQLGMETGTPRTVTAEIGYPFPPENIMVAADPALDTRFRMRRLQLPLLARRINDVFRGKEGTWMVFFPSYAYLSAVLKLVRERIPEEQLLVQDRGMTEGEREAFLAQFTADNQETRIGFAVMGGIFAEGIDLVGERLIGAVVVGVGLPQLCLERDLIRDYFDRENGSGFAYAYQYPGFNRVLQATGRVIRSETDRGVIVLIDERFTQSRYRRLFPTQWRGFQVVQGKADLKEKLGRFWGDS